MSPSRTPVWSNWAGNQRSLAAVRSPTTEAELRRIVVEAAEAGHRVKAVGAGHSFTDVALSDHVMVDLRRYGRILGIDNAAGEVTVQAGCRLHDLSLELWRHGLALENVGDIDVQTVAGATATATHGTGLAFGNLSSTIVALRLVDGRGEVVELDGRHNADLFAAARVGVGALGLLSTVTLRVVPAFHLHAVEEPRRIDEVVESFDEVVAANDHFEFFWVPHTGWALTKTNRRNLDPLEPRSARDEFVQDRLWSNYAFEAVNRVGSWRPSLIPRLGRLLPSTGRVEYNDRSYRVLSTPRLVRFVEMEYAVPLEATMEALAGVRRVVDGLDMPVSFPVEVRTVAGDDIALSPASGRATGYLAVHVYRGTPYETYFRRVEAVMRDLGGRPHWGKLHNRSAEDLAPAYPRWDEFRTARQRLDPFGVFETAAVRRLFGPARP
ncbi:MAG: D-arabinono-1,4-lactone oxidase [Acidimicrobiales bacterium]